MVAQSFCRGQRCPVPRFVVRVAIRTLVQGCGVHHRREARRSRTRAPPRSLHQIRGSIRGSTRRNKKSRLTLSRKSAKSREKNQSGQRDSNPRHLAWEHDSHPRNTAKNSENHAEYLPPGTACYRVILCVASPNPGIHPGIEHDEAQRAFVTILERVAAVERSHRPPSRCPRVGRRRAAKNSGKSFGNFLDAVPWQLLATTTRGVRYGNISRSFATDWTSPQSRSVSRISGTLRGGFLSAADCSINAAITVPGAMSIELNTKSSG